MMTSEFQNDLMSWYSTSARDLPWRQTTNPYYIWLSEVMLQQTQVKTVIPYYEAFIKAFPRIEDLAKASEDTLMSYWQGLGYYRRAKYLHQAAKQIVNEHGSKLPQTAKELIQLKGFGEYTSASVASIAFGQAIACVDGNVKRVMARLFADDTHPAEKSQSLIDENNPGDFNQAIMELGATICTPRNPQCLLCPVQNYCEALKKGLVDQYPKKTKKIKQKNIYTAIIIVECKQHFLMEKRAELGRWENLWQNPSLENTSPLSEDQIHTWINDFISTSDSKLKALGNFNHKLTHQNIHADVFHLKLNHQQVLKKENQKWIHCEKVDDLAVSTFQKKAFQTLSA